MQRTVSYVHSSALLQAADRLPSNLGRASLVHDLVASLDLVDPPSAADTAELRGLGRARTVLPQPATRADLLRFHDPRYIGPSSSSLDFPPPRPEPLELTLPRTCLRRRHPRDRRRYVPAERSSFARKVLADLVAPADDSASSSSSDSSSSSPPPPQSTFGLASDTTDRPHKRRKTDNDALGLQDDCPVFAGLADYARLVAGASMTAARELRDGKADVAISWTGGRHHGKRGEAAGFCYVNDIVLAIMELRSAPHRAPPPASPPPSSPRSLDDAVSSSPRISPPPRAPAPPSPARISRVLYLDLDLHHGDGVESAFLASPYVLTLSVHLHAPLFYPSTGALESTGPPGEPRSKGAFHALNVPLEHGAGEETLRRVWSSCIERVREAYDPEAVVLQLGTDGLAGDPCKVRRALAPFAAVPLASSCTDSCALASQEWNLSLSALGYAVERVLSWNKRTLLLGGGGYHSPNAARAWAYLTSVAVRPLPPPPSLALSPTQG